MSKTLSPELHSHDVFSTYCTTTASAHKYTMPIRLADAIPIENGFTKNRHHQWRFPDTTDEHWQSTYVASLGDPDIVRQDGSGYELSSSTVPIQLSSFSKQNYSNIKTASNAGIESESKSTYSIASFDQRYDKALLNAGQLSEYKWSENGFTRNFAVHQDAPETSTAPIPHSEFKDRYQTPACNTAIHIPEGTSSTSTASSNISGYSKSCIAIQQTNYEQGLDTTTKSTYQKTVRHNSIEPDGKGAEISGFVSNACCNSTSTDIHHRGKGLVGNRALKDGNIELYTVPTISSEPEVRRLTNHQYDLTPSPHAVIMKPMPPSTKADLSDKLTHWKAA